MGEIPFLLKIRGAGKRYQKEFIFCSIIFLTATISFALGYLANREFTHAPIIIEKCAPTPDVSTSTPDYYRKI